MSRIIPIIYQTITDKLPIEKASQYFYLTNLLGVNSELDEEFVDHEVETNHIRNQVIGDLIRSGKCGNEPDLNSVIVGISSLKKETVVMMEC